MKHQAQCCPSSVVMKGKLEVMKTFQRLQKDLGVGVAFEAFQKVLTAVEADMYCQGHSTLSSQHVLRAPG